MSKEAPKIVWRVDPVPTDENTQRGWPGATYETADGEVAATIDHAEGVAYTPDNAKAEDLKLFVRVINHATGNPMRVNRPISTLAEAKTVAGKVIVDHPEFWPTRLQGDE